MEIEKKVDINPSYEWSEDAQKLGISHRELEVFALVSEGYTNKEVAHILDIKYQSVKNHMHHLYKKLKVRNSGEALLVALQMNLVRLKTRLGGVTTEITVETVIRVFRNLLDGKTWGKGIDEKKKRNAKVFFKKHGIEFDNWEIGEERNEDAKGK